MDHSNWKGNPSYLLGSPPRGSGSLCSPGSELPEGPDNPCLCLCRPVSQWYKGAFPLRHIKLVYLRDLWVVQNHKLHLQPEGEIEGREERKKKKLKKREKEIEGGEQKGERTCKLFQPWITMPGKQTTGLLINNNLPAVWRRGWPQIRCSHCHQCGEVGHFKHKCRQNPDHHRYQDSPPRAPFPREAPIQARGRRISGKPWWEPNGGNDFPEPMTRGNKNRISSHLFQSGHSFKERPRWRTPRYNHYRGKSVWVPEPSHPLLLPLPLRVQSYQGLKIILLE